MKLTTALFIVVAVAIISSSSASPAPAKGSTKASLKKDCLKECGDVYKPVCAGDGTGKNDKSFGSECVVANYNCENHADLKIVSEGECPGGGGVRLS